MIRYLLPAMLLAAPVIAAEPAQYEPTTAILLSQALRCEQLATAQYQQLSAQIAAKDKQIADLMKERDELKAKAEAK